MAGFRRARQKIGDYLGGSDWQDHLGEIAAGGHASIAALFSLLLREPELSHRAARALGLTVARLGQKDPEAARNIIRRYMWQMNEDSGNIGWGIPCAFAETLAASPELAKNYAHILLSYIFDLGFADNYVDHAPLRRDCFWAVGRIAQAMPELAEKARPWLAKGLADEDAVCRGMAAWALGQLKPGLAEAPLLRALAESGAEDVCEVFDGGQLRRQSVSALAAEALGRRFGSRG